MLQMHANNAMKTVITDNDAAEVMSTESIVLIEWFAFEWIVLLRTTS
jgi:hypothetical protein